ncbi:MAG TPA: hypothetical protein VFW65_18950 [Pseudonocardiaceae bacterium]|nr:hypothetical protein [Pseudonocardiaceae bacterium]
MLSFAGACGSSASSPPPLSEADSVYLQRGSIDRLVAGGDIVPLDESESVVSRNARAEVERRLARVKSRCPEEYELIMRAVRALDDDQVAQIVTDQ